MPKELRCRIEHAVSSQKYSRPSGSLAMGLSHADKKWNPKAKSLKHV